MRHPRCLSAVALVLLFLLISPVSLIEAVSANVSAHRGSSSTAPENTLAAVRQAIEDRADYAEIDVQLTRDGHVVLFHDKTMKRNLGIPKSVSAYTLAELQTLDAGSWFSSSFAGEPIPTLDAVMQTARDRIKLNIELKAYHSRKKLAAQVVRLIEDNKFAGQCVVTSFDEAALLRVKQLNKSIRTGLIVASPSQVKPALFLKNINILSMRGSLVNDAFMQQARARQLDVFAWTIDSEREMRRLLRLGVDNIITDQPRRMIAAMR